MRKGPIPSLRAFTVLEMIVVMMLTGILVSIGYTLLRIFSFQQQQYTGNITLLQDYFLLKKRMDRALKRVELGNSVQGLDYSYTAQGWLKAINNGNRDQGPGKDGISGANASFAKDAFGMNLEYYSGDYARANSTIGSIPLTAAVAADQYTGSIKGMSWHSRKPQSVIAALGAAIENPTMYGFKYDSRYQLSAGTWGMPDYSIPGFTPGNAFKEYNLAYDANGNMQALARTGEAGTITHNFAYNYQVNTNRLQSVTNGASTYSSYGYNALGQLTTEAPGSGAARYLKYDITGKVFNEVAITENEWFLD